MTKLYLLETSASCYFGECPKNRIFSDWKLKKKHKNLCPDEKANIYLLKNSDPLPVGKIEYNSIQFDQFIVLIPK